MTPMDGILLNYSSEVTQLLHAGLDSKLDTQVSDSVACMTELTREDSLPSDRNVNVVGCQLTPQ